MGGTWVISFLFNLSGMDLGNDCYECCPRSNRGSASLYTLSYYILFRFHLFRGIFQHIHRLLKITLARQL